MFIVHMNQSRKPTLHFFLLLYVKELCPVNHSDFDWFQLLHDIFTKHMLLLSWFWVILIQCFCVPVFWC